MSLFTGFLKLFDKRGMSDYERYLAKATDIFDLERREREWSRGKRV